ncbi:MAG: ATP-dependent Clp protease ATP-binding subunit ClpX [Clostridiales bacterium]|mgnify:FL=1|nr:ATP-dependent Clp protease ATP-binding subunit ClpX [Clostridiales bacterium]
MLVCSFCGKSESPNRKIIPGAKANICSQCFKILKEDTEEIVAQIINGENMEGIMKPHEIKEKMDEYIVGQEEAKRILSVAVYNHYKRINAKSKVDIQKTNIMLIGPTGSGKTYIMQTLAKILNLPIVIVDATSFTEAGYVGDDVESILKKLYLKAGKNLELAEKGIVYIDEIDKIVAKEDSHRAVDIKGSGVQQALLKIIESSEVSFPLKDDTMYDKKEIVMNTKNILFVAGGAFVGLNEIIKKRINKNKRSIGFGMDVRNEESNNNINSDQILQEDIINYGFIPEFIGRIPVIVRINKLSKEELKDILTKPKDALLKQYKELFKIDGIKMEFGNDAIEYIVNEAEKKNLGARGLKGIIEKQMYNLMFELPKYKKIKKFTVTEQILKGNKEEVQQFLNDIESES